MVRKDVKIGAVVLAILLAVIVVYVLVVPSSNKPEASGPQVSADEAFKKQMLDNESRMPPINKPQVASNEPANTPLVSTTPTGSGAGVPLKNDPFADSNEKWVMALNTGTVDKTKVKSDRLADRAAVPADTTTPTVRQAENAVAGNKPASISQLAKTPNESTHTVLAGESIARIAENVYGSQVYYKEILAANPGVDPKKLKPGMVLKIPDVKEVKGKGGAEDDSPAPALDKTEYRVVSGDSMHSIAKKLYGKSEMWQQIYDLNKDKIGNDPAKLKVGMILKLPAAPSGR